MPKNELVWEGLLVISHLNFRFFPVHHFSEVRHKTIYVDLIAHVLNRCHPVLRLSLRLTAVFKLNDSYFSLRLRPVHGFKLVPSIHTNFEVESLFVSPKLLRFSLHFSWRQIWKNISKQLWSFYFCYLTQINQGKRYIFSFTIEPINLLENLQNFWSQNHENLFLSLTPIQTDFTQPSLKHTAFFLLEFLTYLFCLQFLPALAT